MHDDGFLKRRGQFKSFKDISNPWEGGATDLSFDLNDEGSGFPGKKSRGGHRQRDGRSSARKGGSPSRRLKQDFFPGIDNVDPREAAQTMTDKHGNVW